MKTIKIRPKHVPHVLRLFAVEQGMEKMLIDKEWNQGYSTEVLLESLPNLSRDAPYEIVPSTEDVLCDLCQEKYPERDCSEADATLFDPINNHLRTLPKEEREKVLREFFRKVEEEPLLVKAYPFCSLIGNTYSLQELEEIDRKFRLKYLN